MFHLVLTRKQEYKNYILGNLELTDSRGRLYFRAVSAELKQGRIPDGMYSVDLIPENEIFFIPHIFNMNIGYDSYRYITCSEKLENLSDTEITIGEYVTQSDTLHGAVKAYFNLSQLLKRDPYVDMKIYSWMR